MQYLFKYFTSAPIMAFVTIIAVAVFFIGLNSSFPGLQYGTYFHALP